MAAGVGEGQVLDDELDVDDPAGVVLDVELPGAALAAQVGTHFLAHFQHLPRNAAGSRAAQHLPANGIEPVGHGPVAGHRAGPGQGLVLPGPGIVALVFFEGADGGHQHLGVAVGAQPHVHLVERAGHRLGGEDMDHALPELHEERLMESRGCDWKGAGGAGTAMTWHGKAFYLKTTVRLPLSMTRRVQCQFTALARTIFSISRPVRTRSSGE